MQFVPQGPGGQGLSRPTSGQVTGEHRRFFYALKPYLGGLHDQRCTTAVIALY